jgi:hypothetical protein
MIDTAEILIDYCRQNGRVCPLPQLWNQLWGMLPARTQIGIGWQPPLPLILAAWNTTSNLEKMLRFAEHITWAERHNNLEPVASFLRTLREEDWLHLDK